MSEQRTTITGSGSLLLLSTAAALLLLLLRWFTVSAFSPEYTQGVINTQGGIARVLLGLGVASLLAGAGSTVLALLPGWRDARAVAIASPVAALLLLDTYFALGDFPALKLLCAGAVALVVFAVLYRALQRSPAARRLSDQLWTWAVVLLAATLGATALSAVDLPGRAAAGGAALLALALLWWLRARGTGWSLLAVVPLLLAALFIATRIPVLQPANAFAAGKPSVLLVTIDTLRADHVGSYGHAGARTPVLDALAQQGVRFSQAVTANVYTGPSHTSILTGLYPESHGVLVNDMRLPAVVPTLADILAEEGYLTSAFTSGFTTRDRACGLPSRFQASDDDIRALRWWPQRARDIGILELFMRIAKRVVPYNGDFGQEYRMGEDTADQAIAWLAANGGRPFFTWVHFFDPHLPYRPPHRYLENDAGPDRFDWYGMDARERAAVVTDPATLAAMRALYDAEIAYDDAQLGRVVEAARAAAPDGELLIVVVADHGEAMGEHANYWLRDMYDPTLRVPLVMVPPASAQVAPQVVDAQVRTIDLAPTLLSLLEVDAGTRFDGSSLLELIRGDDTQHGPEPALGGLYVVPGEFQRQLNAVRYDGWKLVRTGAGWAGGGDPEYRAGSTQLFNLATDPQELVDVAQRFPEQRLRLDEILHSVAGEVAMPDIEFTPEERERLRSLGYIH